MDCGLRSVSHSPVFVCLCRIYVGDISVADSMRFRFINCFGYCGLIAVLMFSRLEMTVWFYCGLIAVPVMN